ncbi:MAG: hypothetical protein EP330_08575 [Deltaproteobacteria bacterium]|nr:MAG: hypothetical protein EP330_08575 [Deltaproteobacteria bacterium]
MSASWSAIRASWPESWKSALRSGLGRYTESIEEEPERFEARVERWMEVHRKTRAVLQQLPPLIALLPAAEQAGHQSRLLNLLAEHQALAAGIVADDEDITVDIAGPPLLVVAGIAVGVVAIAWAIVSYTHASALLTRAETERRELEARIALHDRGAAPLPGSTLPVPASSPESSSWGAWVAGGLALAATAVLVPLFLAKES